ncbi:cupin domain-containing protein [Idiomarina abyssalis]|uniref:AraC family transcriptional regulator n=1 Tax=Idiomarina abyssalis TaxID=86102 RepID=UPI003A8DC0BF
MMDLLSSVLLALRIESTSISRWRMSAPWGVNVQDFLPGYCLSIVTGQCWVTWAGMEAVQLQPGDTLLALKGGDCQLLSELGTAASIMNDLPWKGEDIQGMDARHRPTSTQKLTWGGGGELCSMLGLAFTFRRGRGDFLLQALPQFIVLRRDDTELLPLTHSAIECLVDDDKPGYIAVADQLAELIIISLIRSAVLSDTVPSNHWIKSLQDRHISRALAAIHAQPQCAWSVIALAQEANLSRSSFAVRFHHLVGQTPMDYVNRWRMQLAADLLTETRTSITLIAQQVGYQSDRAFRRVFNQQMGCSPTTYRKLYA